MTKQEPKFYEMFVEISNFIKDLRKKYGGNQQTSADSLMALCLAVARVAIDEGLSSEIVDGYVKSFMNFLSSLDGKKGAKPLSEFMGNGN